jgi:putative acetyltransferase
MITAPDEFTISDAAEAEFIRRCRQLANSLFLLAEDERGIAGQLTLQGGLRRATRHAAMLGMSVREDRRGQRVGSRLLRTAVDYARTSSPLRRIELNVFADNPVAVHLYERFGFEVEGRRRRVVYRDGRFIDDYVMALLL